jgi:hypothetical protein
MINNNPMLPPTMPPINAASFDGAATVVSSILLPDGVVATGVSLVATLVVAVDSVTFVTNAVDDVDDVVDVVVTPDDNVLSN